MIKDALAKLDGEDKFECVSREELREILVALGKDDTSEHSTDCCHYWNVWSTTQKKCMKCGLVTQYLLDANQKHETIQIPRSVAGEWLDRSFYGDDICDRFNDAIKQALKEQK